MSESTLSRRSLIGTGLAAGAAVGTVAALQGGLTRSALAAVNAKPLVATASDLEILNFALGLEQMESAFYSQVLGAHQEHGFLSGRFLPLTQDLAAAEATHVQTLQATITAAGGTPVMAGTYKFPYEVFVSTTGYSWFAWTLEEIGIGAYLGAIGKIKNPALRKATASIYGSETRHAAILRSLGSFTFAPRYFESALTVAQVKELTAPYIA